MAKPARRRNAVLWALEEGSNSHYDFFWSGTGNGSGLYRNVYTFRSDLPKMQIAGKRVTSSLAHGKLRA